MDLIMDLFELLQGIIMFIFEVLRLMIMGIYKVLRIIFKSPAGRDQGHF